VVLREAKYYGVETGMTTWPSKPLSILQVIASDAVFGFFSRIFPPQNHLRCSIRHGVWSHLAPRHRSLLDKELRRRNQGQVFVPWLSWSTLGSHLDRDLEWYGDIYVCMCIYIYNHPEVDRIWDVSYICPFSWEFVETFIFYLLQDWMTILDMIYIYTYIYIQYIYIQYIYI
jgi:hypothetical protein